MIVITGKAMIEEKNREAFHPVVLRQVTLSRTEPGCLDYGCYEDALAPGTFLFYEEWKDQAAVDFHFQQTYCHEFMEAANRLSSSKPIVTIRHVSQTQSIS
ncbi:MAG: putative quinol monooxygenase [Parvibaculum sp.]